MPAALQLSGWLIPADILRMLSSLTETADVIRKSSTSLSTSLSTLIHCLAGGVSLCPRRGETKAAAERMLVVGNNE